MLDDHDHDHRDVIHYTYDFGRLREFGLEDFENFNDSLSISSGSLSVEVPSEYMFTLDGGGSDISPPLHSGSNTDAVWGTTSLKYLNYDQTNAKFTNFYVGKTIGADRSFSDADGTTNASLTTTWYRYDGNAVTEITTGSEYVIHSDDVGYQIVVAFSFTDDAGNQEVSGYTTGGVNVRDPDASLNERRTQEEYSVFQQYLTSNSITEGSIPLLLGDHYSDVSKWGSGFGTTASITYSLTAAGQLTFADDYKNDIAHYTGDAEILALASFYSDLENRSDENGLGAIAFTDEEKADIHSAIADWGAITGITFVDVTTTAAVNNPADLVFTKLDFDNWATVNTTVSASSAGFAFLPSASDDYIIGDVFIDNDFGNPFKQVVSHEIGHALGLSHPHDGGESVQPPLDPNPHIYDGEGHLENYNTIMSYGNRLDFMPVSPMQLDLAATSALYGDNSSANAGNTAYVENVDTYNPDGNWNLRKMIHDNNGTSDSLTLNSTAITNTSPGIFVNLNSGSYSNFADVTEVNDAATTLEYGNFYLSDDTQIEQLTTTSGHDVIDASVSWAATINCGDGNDTVTSNGANATINGGAGSDTLYIQTSDYGTLYVDATDASNGSIKHKSDDSVYCIATDVEIVRLLGGANRPTVEPVNWLELKNLMPAATNNDNNNNNTYEPAEGDNKQMFEIDIAKRYGDIIEYGVKLKDDANTNTDTSTLTLQSLTLDVSWDNGTYSWWESQFTPSTNAPTGTDVNADEYINHSYQQNAFSIDEDRGNGSQDYSQDKFTVVMLEDTGMTFTENEYVAKFMLKKLTTETSSELRLSKAQYTQLSDSGEEMPVLAEHTFSFSSHAFDVSLKSAGGKEIPNVELFLTDIGTTDGLSIVPVAKNGNVIKYEVVLNIPVPSFIANVAMNPHHLIEISGAGIFENSVQLLTDATLTTTQTGEIVANAAAVVKNAEDATVTTTAPTSATYLGQEFFHTLGDAMDEDVTSTTLSALKTTDEMTFEFTNLVKPGSATAETAEARHVLAEFYAIADGGDGTNAIQFKSGSQTSTQKTDGDAYGFGSLRSIEREFDDNSSAFDSKKTESLGDGSEVVVLGDGLYVNENQHNDAISAEDALGALRIFNAEAATAGSSGDGTYNINQLIAADFNQSGAVTAADAADILTYIVDGEAAGVPVPEWVYLNQADVTVGTTANDLNATNVAYDEVIDLFAYQPINLTSNAINNVAAGGSLTGILRGDVTASYNAAADASTTIKYFTADLSTLYDMGVFSPTETAQTGGSGPYAAAATVNGPEAFTLGSNTGVHVITGAQAVDLVLLDDSLYSISSSDYSDTTAGAPYASDTNTPDNAAIITALDTALKADTGSLAVEGKWADSVVTGDTITAVAFDIDESGAIDDGTADLIIIVHGDLSGDITFISPLDPGAYLDTL